MRAQLDVAAASSAASIPYAAVALADRDGGAPILLRRTQAALTGDNVAGAVLWATGFVLLGSAAGQAFRTAERITGHAGLALLAAIVVGATAALLIHRRRHPGQPTAPPQDRRH